MESKTFKFENKLEVITRLLRAISGRVRITGFLEAPAPMPHNIKPKAAEHTGYLISPKGVELYTSDLNIKALDSMTRENSLQYHNQVGMISILGHLRMPAFLELRAAGEDDKPLDRASLVNIIGSFIIQNYRGRLEFEYGSTVQPHFWKVHASAVVMVGDWRSNPSDIYAITLTKHDAFIDPPGLDSLFRYCLNNFGEPVGSTESTTP